MLFKDLNDLIHSFDDKEEQLKKLLPDFFEPEKRVNAVNSLLNPSFSNHYTFLALCAVMYQEILKREVKKDQELYGATRWKR